MDEDIEESGEFVTIESVQEIAGVIPEDTIDGLLKACEPKMGRSVYTEVAKIVEGMVADGWNASQTVIQVGMN
jgi:replication factor C subunit 2/4